MDDINKVLIVADMLDLRYMMEFLKHCFKVTYNDSSTIEKLLKKVAFMCSLCLVYSELEGKTSGKQVSQSIEGSQPKVSSSYTSTQSHRMTYAFV